MTGPCWPGYRVGEFRSGLACALHPTHSRLLHGLARSISDSAGGFRQGLLRKAFQQPQLEIGCPVLRRPSSLSVLTQASRLGCGQRLLPKHLLRVRALRGPAALDRISIMRDQCRMKYLNLGESRPPVPESKHASSLGLPLSKDQLTETRAVSS